VRGQSTGLAVILTIVALFSLSLLFPIKERMKKEAIEEGVFQIQYGTFYIQHISIDFFKPLFKEPFETVYFIFKDGRGLAITSNDYDYVDCDASVALRYIEDSERKIEDCWLIIHNHLTPRHMTLKDKGFRSYFRDRGFEGIFLIYHQSSGLLEW